MKIEIKNERELLGIRHSRMNHLKEKLRITGNRTNKNMKERKNRIKGAIKNKILKN